MGGSTVVDRSASTSSSTSTSSELEDRIVDAVHECIGRWGIGKTTADDIARTAGISRATLYRVFPGGKDVAFEALLRREIARFFASVHGPLEHATTLEDTVAIGFVEAARFLASHGPLQYLLTHEPERFELTSGGLASAYAFANAFVVPLLRPFVADEEAAAVGADWIVRLFFSYALVPSPALDLADPAAVRRFVQTYIVPALTARP
jgi:AcrR family transcriptional regulator